MASPVWRARLMRVSETVGVIVAAVALASGCASQAQQPAARPSKREVARAQPRLQTRPQTQPRPAASALGVLGMYRVGQRQMTFVEPPHVGPTGQQLGQRSLVTLIRYPLSRRSPSARSSGPYPLLMFAPGFMQCPDPYSRLLQAWASAGYVVAAVDFPRTDCHVGAAAFEDDQENEAADLSYVISSLLALSAGPHDPFSGLIDRHEIAASGQSDGGDVVAALTANTCCTDRRVVAAAVLSGSEFPPPGLGRYFAHRAPPMLFVQGSADVINPPWMSRQLYQLDSPRARYYLDLLGADHLGPYVGTNSAERLVTRVTLAFFDHYVLGQAGALATMTRDGNIGGRAVLASGHRPPP